MKSSSYKRIVSVVISICMLFALINVPASAMVFPCMAVIEHPSKDAAQVWSLPGTEGHEADPINTKSVHIGDLADGTTVQLQGEGIDGDGDIWYLIGYGDGYQSTGYVYSNNVRITAEYVEDAAFETWLTEQNFPESYKPGLRILHMLYPNWKFYADHTNLDFNSVVAAQKNQKYVHINKALNWGLYEEGEYNWENGIWTGHDGSSWIKTTDQVVAYYVDPRNFLDERSIFMFASEKFDPQKENIDFVKNAVKGTFMDAVLPDSTENKTYSDVILAAATDSGVSTATIVALILQEQGSKGESKLISGNYTYTKQDESGKDIVIDDLVGYYNFFNIGAYADEDKGFYSAVQRGLWWAKGAGNGATTYNRPWNTREKAIIGGVQYYGGNYVKVGQDTIYYKNFNVYNNTEFEKYTHQYATNIEDSLGKGLGMADAMFPLLDGEIIFHIPVYLNMPEQTTLPMEGTNNNRFLSSLSIEGYENQFGSFYRYTYSYEAIVSYWSDTINIIATPASQDATVVGAGEVPLNFGYNTLNVTVTSSSGLTCTYTISVYRQPTPEEDAPVPQLTTNYKADQDITGIQPETDVAAFKANLFVTNGRAVVVDSSGNEKVAGIIATGDVVHLYDMQEKIQKSYPVIIYGDVSGDGKISVRDVYYLRRLILGLENLAEANSTAADVNHDNSSSVSDVYYIRRHILGLETISQ